MHWWTNPSPVSPIMRLISLAMATQKKGHVTQPLRSKSTNSKPNKPLARTLATGVSHKSRSDSSIINGLRTLSINDRSNATTPASTKIRQSPIARRISSASSRCQSLEDIARYILAKKAKNIVIMAGAGISTSSGIPDFRSPGTGLYDNLKQYNIPYPEAIFDIDYFTYKPKPFFTLAKELYPSGKYKPNYIHYFCRMLHEKGLLLRMYTQNIDGFERLAGIPPSKLVEAHGTFATATCTGCRKTYPGEEIKEDIFNNKVPYCRNRRSCPGVIKPDIIFFGEDLPRRFWYYLRDFPQADLLIVMGTSLEVEPFAGIVDCTRFNTPRVLLNMKAVGPFKNKKRSNDVVVQGDLLESVQRFANILGWKREMNDLIFNENQKVPESALRSAEADAPVTKSGSIDCTNSLVPMPLPLKLPMIQKEKPLHL
ncbi:NAD-dependent protein deacetylase sirtuin-3-like isoform X2 [Lineus longissimus]|uniref:NAD-dependent protein deacetylase sirtuin-3-like isoform X2 n=1 Tax=Lineus longissimus TaxID=88925 RepID=UPI002B4E5ED9